MKRLALALSLVAGLLFVPSPALAVPTWSYCGGIPAYPSDSDWRVDDTYPAPSMTYAGTWVTGYDPAALGGTFREARSPDAVTTFYFFGNGITIHYRASDYLGSAYIYIDGALVHRFSQMQEDREWRTRTYCLPINGDTAIHTIQFHGDPAATPTSYHTDYDGYTVHQYRY